MQGKRRIYIKRALAIAVSLGILAVILSFLTDLVVRKNSIKKYKDFFEEENDFDVLFLGSSHMLNGVYPMELWNDYGIVSYNLGGHSNEIATSYWVMEMALEYTDPELVVVDCYLLSHNYKTSTKYSYVHLSMDAFPLSFTKIRAVFDLLDDDYMDAAIADGKVEVSEERTPISLLWNFSVYHTRWSSLTANDLDPAGSKEKGAESRINVAVPKDTVDVSPDDKWEGSSVGLEYLEKLMEDCESRGIEVLLINIPYPAGEGNQRVANRLYDIAEEYGVGYINFLNMDVVDYDTDMNDKGSHLNPSGARKVTDYLGEYITEHYDITDKRLDAAYSSWYEDYEEYKDLKVSNMNSQTDADCYIMLMYDKNYDVRIEIGDRDFFEDEYYCRLFENIGIDVGMVTEDVTEIVVEAAGEKVEYLDGEVSTDDGISFTVTDRDTGEVVSQKSFEYTVSE